MFESSRPDHSISFESKDLISSEPMCVFSSLRLWSKLWLPRAS